jgi:anti-sigma B factor antagonist
VQNVDLPDIRAEQLHESCWVVELVGEHDLATAPDLEQALAEVEAHGTSVIVDLSETTFIDSTILGVLVTFAEKPQERVALVAPPGTAPRRVIDVVGMQSRFSIYDARADAAAALQE